MKYFVFLGVIGILLISGCTGTNVAQSLTTEYGQIHDYNLKETYNYFDGKTEVKYSTYIQPAQQTSAGLLNEIENIAKQFYGVSIKEEEYNGKSVYVMALTWTSNTYRKDETTTQVFWIDRESYLPLKMERYVSGSDSLFEKLRQSPEILDIAYADSASQNIIFVTTGWGYRLFTVDYEFTNINKRPGESIDCYQYFEDTGICVTEIESHQWPMIEDFDDVRSQLPDTRVPSYAMNFTFSYLLPRQTKVVEEPYLFADGVTEVMFRYCSDKFHGTYDYRCWRHDLDASLQVFQSDDGYLILSELPIEGHSVQSVTVKGNNAVFSDYKTESSKRRISTLRWGDNGKYYFLKLSDTESFGATLYDLDTDKMKTEMIRIAESLTQAQGIE